MFAGLPFGFAPFGSVFFQTSIDSLTEVADNLGYGGALTVPRLYGGASGLIYRECLAGEVVDKFSAYRQPLLESADMYYSSTQTMKETESMVVDGTGSIQLSVAGRDMFDDDVVYVLQSQTWTKSLPEKRLTFPRLAAKVFRYKFTPVIAANTVLVNRSFAHVEIGTAKYKDKFFEAYVTAPFAGIFLPSEPVGTFTVVAIGAGGGGGARPYAAVTQNTFVPTASLVAFTNTSKLEKLVLEYVAADLHTYTLTDVVPGSLVPNGVPVYIPYDVLIPDPNRDPGLSTTIADLLYQTAVARAKTFYKFLGVNFSYYGTISVYFKKIATGGAAGILYTSWAAGTGTLLVMPANVWEICVDYFSSATNPVVVRGAGGSGAYVRARITLDASMLGAVLYTVGQPTNGTLLGNGSKGGTGTLTTVVNGWQVNAGGGVGGGDNGAGAVVNGAAGTDSSLGAAGMVIDQTSPGVAGQNGPVRGGASWTKYAVVANSSQRDMRGYYYGGGGCGQLPDYRTNLGGTRGASGYLWIGWRVGPDGLAYPAAGFSGSVIEKVANQQKSESVLVLSGSNVAQTLTISVKGVVETKLYTGGALVNGKCYLNGTPNVDTRSVLKLTIGANIYYLNYEAAPANCCVPINYSFTITVAPNQSCILSLDNQDSKQWEPRDINGVAIDTSEGSDLHEPQWCTVEVTDYIATPVLAEALTRFTSFSELIYNGGQIVDK